MYHQFVDQLSTIHSGFIHIECICYLYWNQNCNPSDRLEHDIETVRCSLFVIYRAKLQLVQFHLHKRFSTHTENQCKRNRLRHVQIKILFILSINRQKSQIIIKTQTQSKNICINRIERGLLLSGTCIKQKTRFKIFFMRESICWELERICRTLNTFFLSITSVR